MKWNLKAPDGTEYRCDNLSKFVQEHKHLFSAQDVRYYANNRSCCAQLQLANLGRTIWSWKGWEKIGHPPVSKEERYRKSGLGQKNWIKSHPEEFLKYVKKRAARLMGVPAKSPRRKSGPTHFNARVYRLCSPDGDRFVIKNLLHFIRENEFLFNPDDVNWVPRKPGSLVRRCRALNGLYGLFHHGVRVAGSWKGWTAVSVFDRKDLNEKITL